MKTKTNRALIIGCGNIGAFYDLNSHDILSHAKAYYENKLFNFSILDENEKKTNIVKKKYNCFVEQSIDNLNKYNFISICSPTSTHYKYLTKCLIDKIPLVICEKPISNSIKELNKLKLLYNKSDTKVIVNYFRQFHPSFIKLKLELQKYFSTDNLIMINVRYHKGFLNNCSHAINLIEFLYDIEINFSRFNITNINFDHFDDDPTITASGKSDNININLIGFNDIKYSIFEIDLIYANSMIKVQDSGNTIQYFVKSRKIQKFPLPLVEKLNLKKTNAIYNRMKHVIKHSSNIYKYNLSDNFLKSLDLNIKMVNFLKNKI
jgi:hypothetical protein